MRLSNGDVEKTYQNGYTPVGGAQKGEEDASCTAKCWRMKIAWLPAGMLLGVVFFGAALYFLGQGRSCGDHNLVGGVFCTHYTSHIIGTIPGLSSFYGGMVFLRGDPNTMLVAGYADSPQGAIYRVLQRTFLSALSHPFSSTSPALLLLFLLSLSHLSRFENRLLLCETRKGR